MSPPQFFLTRALLNTKLIFTIVDKPPFLTAYNKLFLLLCDDSAPSAFLNLKQVSSRMIVKQRSNICHWEHDCDRSETTTISLCQVKVTDSSSDSLFNYAIACMLIFTYVFPKCQFQILHHCVRRRTLVLDINMT